MVLTGTPVAQRVTYARLTQAVIPFKAGTTTESASASLRRALVVASRLALVAAGYYVAARLGQGFRFQNSQISVVWPANAVLVAALLLTPRSRWWQVLVVVSLAHVVAMMPVTPGWRVAWQIGANSLFAVGMTEALRRFAGLPMHFGSRRQVLVYAAVSLVVPVLHAAISPSFVRAALQLDTSAIAPVALVRAALSNATGLLLIGPVLLLWAQRRDRPLSELSWRRVLEASAITLSLLGVGIAAFGSAPEIAHSPSLLLWFFPLLVWAAVRLGPVGAATSVCFVALLSTLGTAQQLGPFVIAPEVEQILSLQLFWIAIGPPILLLAAVIREREQAEAALHDQRNQLAHVTRVATVGELSGALAHELRQPLMSILANAQAAIRLLDQNPANTGEVREILEDITREDKQAASVIARLRAFLREGESRFEPLAVDTVIRDALALSKSAVTLACVDVQTQIPAGLPRVWGDPVQILQVMVNLVVNGCEAMSHTASSERYLRVYVAPLGHDQVEVLVADAGIGLPNGREDRVFDPFFTTKEHGLGLGLAIGRSIVTAHGGRLWGENNLYQGATFHLVLRTYDDNGRHATTDRYH
jgi:signal transduction histidine kinase